ncbi:MAG: respiratory chain complex I subunit 1 family protein [Lutibacter sp.]
MVSVILIFIGAFLFPGIVSITKSKLAGRKGISLLQPWYDFFKLIKKGMIISNTTSIIFQVATVINSAVLFVVMFFIPFSYFQPGIIHFEGDFLLFIYLLALGKFFLIISALDTGSSFEGMGANREALYSLLVEPAFFMIIGTLVLISGNLSFSELFQQLDLNFSSGLLFTVLSIYILLQFILIEGSRLPIDDPKTHLELTMIHEVMVLDNSGIDLAFIELGNALKFSIFSALIANIILAFIPVSYFYAIVVFVITQIILAVIIGVLESFRARLKLIYNSQFILTISSISVVLFLMMLLLKNSF